MIPATEMTPNHHRNDPHHRNDIYSQSNWCRHKFLENWLKWTWTLLSTLNSSFIHANTILNKGNWILPSNKSTLREIISCAKDDLCTHKMITRYAEQCSNENRKKNLPFLLFFSWSTCYVKGSQEQKNNCELQNNSHDVNDLKWQLRTNSSKAKFDEHALFKQRLQHMGYSDNLLNITLSEVNFSQRM